MYRSLVQLWMEKKMSDSSQICDHQFLSITILITNQSTNIDYYQVLSINRLRFRWSISIDLQRPVIVGSGVR